MYDDAEAAAAGDAKIIDVARRYRVWYLGGKDQRPDEAAAIANTINLDHLNKRQRGLVEGFRKSESSTGKPPE